MTRDDKAAIPGTPVLRQKPPRAPGLYWFTLIAGSGLHWCRVWRQDGVLMTAAGDGAPVPVARLGHRYWAGPLPEPARLPSRQALKAGE